MGDNIRIDSHKLMFHPKRVAEWHQGENIYPIYVEIAPSGTCNHRCVFCALDYMEYKPVFLDKSLILERLKEMAVLGIKSVMYAGEGEPLLNKHTPEIVNETKSLGIDVSITTNGVLFTEEVTRKCFSSFSWVRFSLNAGSSKNYSKIHKTKEEDFEKVLRNLEFMVKYKTDNKVETTIGTQLLLIPENIDEVVLLGKQLKEIGVDYFSIKPYSQHPMSNNALSRKLDYDDYFKLENELKELEDDNFRIMFRVSAMKNLKKNKQYDRCWGLPFWAYVDANANVWGCSAYLGDEEFLYGNLKESSFSDIWNGEKRKKSMEYVSCMTVDNCREICRLDQINQYLNELKNPSKHINFI